MHFRSREKAGEQDQGKLRKKGVLHAAPPKTKEAQKKLKKIAIENA
jgi:hypothetical protein